MKKLGITIIMAAALSLNSAAALPMKFNPDLYAFNPDLNITVEAGTTGIGFGVSSRVNEYFGVRTSFTWMPHFEFPMHFNIQIGDGKPYYDKQGRSRFDRMAESLKEMTGFEIDQQVDMIGEPHFHNVKLLVDVYPFNDKRWYFTAGFYAGPSVIGRAYNRTEEMTTLVTLSMYNNIYDRVDDLENNPESEHAGKGFEFPYEINEKILSTGRMGMHVGDFADGTPYIMEPDKDSMVKAQMKVNAFKPYIGAGYNGLIYRNNDRLKFSFDCGVMFWGGAPKVYTHDGTEITSLNNLNGQVAKYINLSNKLKVFPLLNLGVSYTLFK